MHKFKRRGVQREPRTRRQSRGMRIEFIAQDGMADLCEMHAQLV